MFSTAVHLSLGSLYAIWRCPGQIPVPLFPIHLPLNVRWETVHDSSSTWVTMAYHVELHWCLRS